MAEIKSLYNVPAVEAALQLLWRTHAWQPLAEFVTYSMVSLDGLTARLDIVARPFADDGRPSPYRGTVRFTHSKAELTSILPNDLVYDQALDATFDQVQRFMTLCYGFLIEPGEFEVVGQEGNGPFAAGSQLLAVPDGSGRIHLRATANSLRWKAGELLSMVKI